MSYSCVYESTVFYDPKNKHSIIRVRTKDENVPNKARKATGSRDDFIRFVARGYNLPQTSKISMVLEGEWETNKYGTQLNVESCEEIVPYTDEGMKGYLSSCLVKGIGSAIADEIIKRFGADTINIIENEPERLLEIKGISEQKLEDIKRTFNESYSVRSLMILLSPYNISPATAIKIYDYFGAKSIDILSENPYRLCEISGFGFKRVDAIVRKGDTPLNSPTRIQGAIITALDKEQQENGHLYVVETTLLQTTAEMLNEELPSPDMLVKSSEIDVIIDDMILGGDIVSSEGRIYSRKCFIMENETAEKVAQLVSQPPLAIDISSILEHVRKNFGIALSQRQSEAVYMAFSSNLSIITGSPGTGKTTVLRAIIEVFKALNPKGKIKLAAPTGRASRRMAESTGQDDASTLHSMLGLQGEDGYFNKDKEYEPIDADLIIVDESSMIDMWLARQFFVRVKPTTRVVLVGDVDQLQSVGAGDVFRELIKCGLIPVTVLDQIFRQQEGSRIAINAKAINNDQTKLSYGDDFSFYKCQTQDQAADNLAKLLCIDSAKLKELKENGGDSKYLIWLQFEKQSCKPISADIKKWFIQNGVMPRNLNFITDKMSIIQIYNYLNKQMCATRMTCKEVLEMWQDYLEMAINLNIDINDEIIYRANKLRQRHAELIKRLQEKDLNERAKEILKSYPKIPAILSSIKSKYEYVGNEYSVIVPEGIEDILLEGRNLNHCVAEQDRYIDRIERQEAYILFLRKNAEPDVSYYTLEVEPGGTIRQKRSKYDRQYDDIDDAKKFLEEWQKVIKKRLDDCDNRLAEKSKILRLEEFAELDENNILIHGGELQGIRLVDVLMKDLMEAA